MLHSERPPMALQAPLAGFEHINRYWDQRAALGTAKLLPGEYYVTCHDEVLVTVVAGCIGVAVRDTHRGVGGLAHFTLPARHGGEPLHDSEDYGRWAMELLLQGVLRQDARRHSLEAMLFGAAEAWPAGTAQAQASLHLVRRYLHDEGVQVSVEDVGYALPRKVYFQPRTGEVVIRRLQSFNDTIRRREAAYVDELGMEWEGVMGPQWRREPAPRGDPARAAVL